MYNVKSWLMATFVVLRGDAHEEGTVARIQAERKRFNPKLCQVG